MPCPRGVAEPEGLGHNGCGGNLIKKSGKAPKNGALHRGVHGSCVPPRAQGKPEPPPRGVASFMKSSRVFRRTSNNNPSNGAEMIDPQKLAGLTKGVAKGFHLFLEPGKIGSMCTGGRSGRAEGAMGASVPLSLEYFASAVPIITLAFATC
jgi:hypothetical protein